LKGKKKIIESPIPPLQIERTVIPEATPEGILFQSSTVLDNKKDASCMTVVVVHQLLRDCSTHLSLDMRDCFDYIDDNRTMMYVAG
jgi:hypothetical protein